MEHALAFYETREFWVAVAFFIFVAAVYRPITRALFGALDARAERVRAEIDEAARLHEEAKTLLASYERKQREAAKEAAEIVGQAKKEAESLRRRTAEELEASLSRREKMGLERIAQAEAEAVQEVRGVAVDIAAAATRKLLSESVDAKKAETLIDSALKELPEKFH